VCVSNLTFSTWSFSKRIIYLILIRPLFRDNTNIFKLICHLVTYVTCRPLYEKCILCVLDRASSWYLNKGRPTWCHLFYYVNLLLNMFRMLIQPSSGACDYLVCYCRGSTCIPIPQHQQPFRYIPPTRLKPAQHSLCNNTRSSRKLLKMVVLTSETCWAVNWHNKINDIKLVYLYSKNVLSQRYVTLSSLYTVLSLCHYLGSTFHISVCFKWRFAFRKMCIN